MTAPLIFTIYMAWEVLELVSARLKFEPLPFAAPVAGIACAAFGYLFF